MGNDWNDLLTLKPDASAGASFYKKGVAAEVLIANFAVHLFQPNLTVGRFKPAEGTYYIHTYKQISPYFITGISDRTYQTLSLLILTVRRYTVAIAMGNKIGDDLIFRMSSSGFS